MRIAQAHKRRQQSFLSTNMENSDTAPSTYAPDLNIVDNITWGPNIEKHNNKDEFGSNTM